MQAGTARVLIVDDEAPVLTALKRMLHGQPYDVLTARGASEGLALMDETEFAVLISDYRMPDMDGVAFLQEAKRRQPDSVRMILTGYADIGLVVDAVNKGEIFRFVAKPWNDHELLLTIAHSLEHWRLLQDNRRLALDLQARNAELCGLNDNLELEVARRSRELLLKDRRYLLSQFIIENLPVALLGIDENDMIALANRRATELWASSGSMLIGSGYREVFDSSLVEAVDSYRSADRTCAADVRVGERTYRVYFVPVSAAITPRNGFLLFTETGVG